MDLWSWISDLPSSDDWTHSSSFTFNLATHGNSSIQLTANRSTASADSDTSLTFAVELNGFPSSAEMKTLWVSNACSLSSDKPFLPLILQLLQEIISRSPAGQKSTCPRSRLQKLKPDPVAWIMDSHSPESFSGFFNLIFLIRLFWVCACDAPAEIGSFYFKYLLSPHLEALSSNHAPVLRTFLITIGVDAELCFTRTLGYVIAKWLILREVGVGLQTLTHAPPKRSLGFTYATEAHGLWILKGHAPVMGMRVTRGGGAGRKYQFPLIEAKESALRYALAHQQLEAVIQLEYSVKYQEGYVHVGARVDNIRLHVARLALGSVDDVEYAEERHFVSRVRVWVGPEVGANYVGAMSLGRSTENVEREVKVQKILKSRYGKAKMSTVKATARTSTRTKMRNWRWDQEAEGNAAVFEAVLCDNTTGNEVAMKKNNGGSEKGEEGGGESFANRYGGTDRAFSKSGGVVFGGDEYGEEVGWRLSKETEGSVLKWRIGGQIWLTYYPNEMRIPYFETRFVEWCDEVDLPLIPTK
ncbi:hypothetical protein IC582_013515 [Cucumis melo]|uniref:Uncharacterized protein LOC103496192 n=1 Tax=Cucumis melo TaxID=3656 RepID=A0A1S3C2Q8_CUCME|nr:uncharacterized protein LOC103496192 [Cucumis melo]